MTDFLNNLIKSSGNKYAGVVSNGIDGSDVTGFIDSGSYSFNALLSGSMYGGIPDNKITAIAGESATGKTYFALGMAHTFLNNNKEGVVLYFDSESAVTSDMIKERGMDPNRVAIFPIVTVETFRHQALSIVDSYTENKDKKPVMIILDSMGMLSTEKEIADTSEGKTTRDMTRAQVLKATFRVLTIKLGKAGIPLVLTNHTYNSIGSMFPTKELSGGQGLRYAASTIVFLSKKKVKEGTDVIGNIIHCKLYKSRFTKENSIIDVMLSYSEGLNPYYGLVDIAIKYNIFSKVSNKIELPDGTKVFEKRLYKEPEKYFTSDIMEQLEDAVAKEFKYGSIDIQENEENESTEI